MWAARNDPNVWPDAAVLARRSEIVAALQAIVPGEGVIEDERERRAFERDSLIAYRQLLMVGHYGPRVAGKT